MPFRPSSNYSRYRNRRKTQNAQYRPRIGYSRLNFNSRKTFSQNQSVISLWLKTAGDIQASRTTSYINNRFGNIDLLSVDTFNQACYLYEQYKVVKMILTLIPTGNRTSQREGNATRGSLATYIDTPPLNISSPVSMNDIINNSSCRMHISDTHIIKRYLNRPYKQYPKWALIERDPLTGTPNPAEDLWNTTMNVYGDNFICGNPDYSNKFYWYRLSFKVLFKCRANN